MRHTPDILLETSIGFFGENNFQSALRRFNPNFQKLKTQNRAIEKYLLFDNSDMPYMAFAAFVSDPRILGAENSEDVRQNVLFSVATRFDITAYTATRDFIRKTRVALTNVDEDQFEYSLRHREIDSFQARVKAHLSPMIRYYAPELTRIACA